jgi:sarcosine oxidase
MMTENQDFLYDAIIVGLGGHGSAIAYHASKLGRRVLGFEKFAAAGHNHGSSHGKSRIFRTAYFEDPAYVPLLKRSLILWKDLLNKQTEMSGNESIPLLKMTGMLSLGKPDSIILKGTMASIAEYGLEHEFLSADEIKTRWPGIFCPSDSEIGILEKQAGVLVPEECCKIHAKLAEQHGAELIYGAEVISWDVDPNTLHVSVHLADGRSFGAKKVALCVGGWANDLFQLDSSMSSRIGLSVERRAMHWFKPNLKPREDNGESSSDINLHLDSMPAYIWETNKEGKNFYGFPCTGSLSTDGMKIAMHNPPDWLKLKIKNPSELQDVFSPCVDESLIDREIDELKVLTRGRLPWLDATKDSHLEVQLCSYTMTANEHFLIDYHPKSEYQNSILLVSPCSGHGFKFCSVMGEICAALLSDEDPGYDLKLFSMKSHIGE